MDLRLATVKAMPNTNRTMMTAKPFILTNKLQSIMKSWNNVGLLKTKLGQPMRARRLHPLTDWSVRKGVWRVGAGGGGRVEGDPNYRPIVQSKWRNWGDVVFTRRMFTLNKNACIRCLGIPIRSLRVQAFLYLNEAGVCSGYHPLTLVLI